MKEQNKQEKVNLITPYEKYNIPQKQWETLKAKYGELRVVELQRNNGEKVVMVLKKTDLTTLSMVSAQAAKEQHVQAAVTLMKRLSVYGFEEDHAKDTELVMGFINIVPALIEGATAKLEKY